MKKSIVIICIVFIIVLGFRWKTYLRPEFINSSSTGHILDTHFWYSPDDAYRIISGFSERSFEIYLELFLWDMVLPIVYCYLSVALFSVTFNRKYLFIIFPIVAMIFDYIENTSSFIAMQKFPVRIDFLYLISNLSGTVKYSFQYITWSLFFVSLIIQLYRSLHSRKNDPFDYL